MTLQKYHAVLRERNALLAALDRLIEAIETTEGVLAALALARHARANSKVYADAPTPR